MKREYIILTLGFCILFVCACAGTKLGGNLITPQNLKDISGIEWDLTQMTKDNATIALVKDSKTTFACDENGNVTGKATLNRYSGNLKLRDDGEIVWNQAFIMTRMAGPPELMQQETDFIQALMNTSRIYLKASKLVLMGHSGSTVLEFNPAKK